MFDAAKIQQNKLIFLILHGNFQVPSIFFFSASVDSSRNMLNNIQKSFFPYTQVPTFAPTHLKLIAMHTTFKIIIGSEQGGEAYQADNLSEAFAIYEEQLESNPDSQVQLMRDMPPTGKAYPRPNTATPRTKRHGKIDSRYLEQNTEGADPTNPLYGKKVVMSGIFDQIGMERDKVAESIQQLGAKLNRSVSSTMQVFVMGNKIGPTKIKEVEQLRATGHDILLISQLEFKEIVKKYLDK